MTRVLLLLVVLFTTLSPAAAQAPSASGLPPGVSAADSAAIRGVIAGQLDAFRHDDAAAAYAFAAPNIQGLFPTPEIFLDMVRRGYPPVYRPLQQEFSELALRDGEVVQEVELVGPDNHPVVALYSMKRDGRGGWLISGCALIPSVRVGA